jgi:hypothetical protein
MAKDYLGQARKELDPQYASKLQEMKNTLATQLANLDAGRTGVNQNFDKQIENQNLQNTLGKNNFSNTMLGRGFGRSSMVTTGLAGMDDKNTRLIGNINADRTSSLNNIDLQKSTLQNNSQSMIGQLSGEKESAIMALARQLEDRDWERQYKMMSLSKSNDSNNSPSIRAGSAYSDALSDINLAMGGNYNVAYVQGLNELMNEFSSDTTKEGAYVRQMIQKALANQNALKNKTAGGVGGIGGAMFGAGNLNPIAKMAQPVPMKSDTISGADINASSYDAVSGADKKAKKTQPKKYYHGSF